jgi:hypothetical protein
MTRHLDPAMPDTQRTQAEPVRAAPDAVPAARRVILTRWRGRLGNLAQQEPLAGTEAMDCCPAEMEALASHWVKGRRGFAGALLLRTNHSQDPRNSCGDAQQQSRDRRLVHSSLLAGGEPWQVHLVMGEHDQNRLNIWRRSCETPTVPPAGAIRSTGIHVEPLFNRYCPGCLAWQEYQFGPQDSDSVP